MKFVRWIVCFIYSTSFSHSLDAWQFQLPATNWWMGYGWIMVTFNDAGNQSSGYLCVDSEMYKYTPRICRKLGYNHGYILGRCRNSPFQARNLTAYSLTCINDEDCQLHKEQDCQEPAEILCSQWMDDDHHKCPSPIETTEDDVLHMYFGVQTDYIPICAAATEQENHALATVACSQNGYTDGNHEIWASDKRTDKISYSITCKGDERYLGDCSSSSIMWDGCKQTLALRCSNNTSTIQLVGGEKNRGLVEIYHKTRWGGICMNDNNPAAKVVCRGLGFLGGFNIPASQYTPQEPHFVIRDVQCNGSELHLEDCNIEWYNQSQRVCPIGQLAVECSNVQTNISEGALQLVGGDTPLTGYLKVYHNEAWRTVCFVAAQNLTRIAQELLTELKIVNTHTCTIHVRKRPDNESDMIWFSDNCTTKRRCIRSFPCTYALYAICQLQPQTTTATTAATKTTSLSSTLTSETTPTTKDHMEGAVRLIPFHTLVRTEGRVQVYHRGIWGEVCQTGWDERDTAVVCRQLHLGPGHTYRHPSPSSSIYIWYNKVGCLGSELTLASCPKSALGSPCLSSSSAAVSCNLYNNVQLGAVRISTPPSGKVQMFLMDYWGGICVEWGHLWTDPEADVACRELGYTHGLPWVTAITSGWVAHWSEVKCQGTEKSLHDCSISHIIPRTCRYQAAVTCTNEGNHGFDKSMIPWIISICGGFLVCSSIGLLIGCRIRKRRLERNAVRGRYDRSQSEVNLTVISRYGLPVGAYDPEEPPPYDVAITSGASLRRNPPPPYSRGDGLEMTVIHSNSSRERIPSGAHGAVEIRSSRVRTFIRPPQHLAQSRSNDSGLASLDLAYSYLDPRTMLEALPPAYEQPVRCRSLEELRARPLPERPETPVRRESHSRQTYRRSNSLHEYEYIDIRAMTPRQVPTSIRLTRSCVNIHRLNDLPSEPFAAEQIILNFGEGTEV